MKKEIWTVDSFSNLSDKELIDIWASDIEAELKKRGYEYGWHKKELFSGVIYILVNPAFPDLVKIGYSDNIQKRMKTLNSNSGLPDPYHCYAFYRVRKRLEDLKLHNLIDSLDPALRHSKNREFYEMNKEKAYEILYAIAQINGDEDQLIKNPFSDSFFDIQQTSNKDNSNYGKKQNLKFSMIGIPIGSTLTFAKDNSIKCTTVDDTNKVNYCGETYSISSLAKKLLNVSAAQGGLYFMYNGELLTEIRNRLGK